MPSSISTTPPELSPLDYAYAIVKGAISSIPVPLAPGIAAEVLSLIISSPISERQEKWFSSLAQALVALQETVEEFHLDKLSDNESFISVVLQTTQIALRNHQKEKLDALRNAVLNSALPNRVEDYRQQIFIRLMDELTPLHLEVLHMLMDMKERYDNLPEETKQGFVIDLTDLRNFLGKHDLDVEFLQLIFKELDSYRLANIHGLAKTGFHIDFSMSRPTKLGEMFLSFISAPDV